MADLIHFQPQLAHVEPHFEGHTPFMNLTFAFVNGSPFDIRFDRAEGFVHYRGEPFRTGLMDPTRVSSATAFTEIVIPHGRQNWFRLRQWLDLLPARMLAEEVGRSGTAVLETQALAICFTYVDSYTTGGTNERREVRVGIPGTPFRIAGA